MFALSTALTFIGAGGFGLAVAIVLDYFGLLGATRQDTSAGQLVFAAVLFVVAAAVFWVGRRVRARG
jgi:uncharacterized membrane protein YdcZ (DUF606 family)